MKKFLMLLVAVMMFGINANADNISFDEMIEKNVNYDLHFNMKEFNKERNLPWVTRCMLNSVVDDMVIDIKGLEDSTVMNKSFKLDSIVSRNLYYAKKYLDSNSYRVYCQMMQKEFNRTGVTKIYLNLN